MDEVLCVVEETGADADVLSGRLWIVLLVALIVMLTATLVISVICFVVCTRRPKRLRLTNGNNLVCSS